MVEVGVIEVDNNGTAMDVGLLLPTLMLLDSEALALGAEIVGLGYDKKSGTTSITMGRTERGESLPRVPLNITTKSCFTDIPGETSEGTEGRTPSFSRTTKLISSDFLSKDSIRLLPYNLTTKHVPFVTFDWKSIIIRHTFINN